MKFKFSSKSNPPVIKLCMLKWVKIPLSHFKWTKPTNIQNLIKISAQKRWEWKINTKLRFFLQYSKSLLPLHHTHTVNNERKSDLFPNGTLSCIHDRNWLKMIPWLEGYFILVLFNIHFPKEMKSITIFLSLPYFFLFLNPTRIQFFFFPFHL